MARGFGDSTLRRRLRITAKFLIWTEEDIAGGLYYIGTSTDKGGSGTRNRIPAPISDVDCMVGVTASLLIQTNKYELTQKRKNQSQIMTYGSSSLSFKR